MKTRTGIAVLTAAVVAVFAAADSFAQRNGGNGQGIRLHTGAPAPAGNNSAGIGQPGEQANGIRLYRGRRLGADENMPRPERNGGPAIRRKNDCFPGPRLRPGEIQLTGIVSELTNTGFIVVDGALEVDTADARIVYVPWFPFEPEAEEEELDSYPETTVEEGDKVSLRGKVVSLDDPNTEEVEEGLIVVAKTVRVTDPVHTLLPADEGGLRGLIDRFDRENGALVVAGIEFMLNEETFYRPPRPWETGGDDEETDEAIEDEAMLDDVDFPSGLPIHRGFLASVHFRHADMDGDGTPETLHALRVKVSRALYLDLPPRPRFDDDDDDDDAGDED